MSSTTTTTGGWYVAHMCPRCRGNHDLRECPQVRAIEYHEDGIRIKRVEFLTPGDYMPPVDNTPFPLGPVTVTTTDTASYSSEWHKTWTAT